MSDLITIESKVEYLLENIDKLFDHVNHNQSEIREFKATIKSNQNQIKLLEDKIESIMDLFHIYFGEEMEDAE